MVMDLVEKKLGFDAVDGGALDESWRQQPGTPSYCHDLDAEAMKRSLADARPERLAQYHEESLEADAGPVRRRTIARLKHRRANDTAVLSPVIERVCYNKVRASWLCPTSEVGR
jgi:hypothetical protein